MKTGLGHGGRGGKGQDGVDMAEVWALQSTLLSKAWHGFEDC